MRYAEGIYIYLSLAHSRPLFRLPSSFIVNCLSKYPDEERFEDRSETCCWTFCGRQSERLWHPHHERSILNNAVKMPILSSFWDWKHFPRLKKRVQPGWQGARGNCICRCDCVTCLPNVHLSGFSKAGHVPLSLLFAVIFVAFRGLSNEYLVLVNAGTEKIVLDEVTYGYTWNCIISCLIKLFLYSTFFSFSIFECIFYIYFILLFESYIFGDIVYSSWKEWCKESDEKLGRMTKALKLMSHKICMQILLFYFIKTSLI